MRVLYVSKASVVAAHRDKLVWLARHAELEVVIPERWAGTEDVQATEGVALNRLPVLFAGKNHFHVYRGLGRVLDGIRPDLVHMDEEPYSAVTLQGGWAASRRGLPFVFFAAQNIPKRYPPPFGAVRRWVFDNAAGGIAGTEQAAEVLRRFGFRKPLRVIPQMGVDPSVFRADPAAAAATSASLGCPPEKTLVAFVGRLVREKGIDLLLAAVERIPEVHCAIVGAGPEEGALRALAGRLGVEDRVRFVGPLPSLDVPALLAGADVLCLPSRSTQRGAEQFGRVLVEAMSTELPVVVTECGGMPGVVGDCGVVVPEENIDALTDALRTLASDPGLRRDLGARGRARVENEYSQARVVEETMAFYSDILRGAA